MSGTYDIFV